MPLGGHLTIETANALLDQSYCRAHAEVKPGRYVMLAVSDTGRGMDERTKSHIFEPFFAGVSASREPEKVTGLGLAMIDGFIKQSGGHVQVHSAPGQGSTFQIYLPAMESGSSR
jgi:signal transduction histidine kinase